MNFYLVDEKKFNIGKKKILKLVLRIHTQHI